MTKPIVYRPGIQSNHIANKTERYLEGFELRILRHSEAVYRKRAILQRRSSTSIAARVKHMPAENPEILFSQNALVQ